MRSLVDKRLVCDRIQHEHSLDDSSRQRILQEGRSQTASIQAEPETIKKESLNGYCDTHAKARRGS